MTFKSRTRESRVPIYKVYSTYLYNIHNKIRFFFVGIPGKRARIARYLRYYYYYYYYIPDTYIFTHTVNILSGFYLFYYYFLPVRNVSRYLFIFFYTFYYIIIIIIVIIIIIIRTISWKSTTTSFQDRYNILLYRYYIRPRRLRVINACKRLLYIQHNIIVECARKNTAIIILNALCCCCSWDDRKLHNDNIIIIF